MDDYDIEDMHGKHEECEEVDDTISESFLSETLKYPGDEIEYFDELLTFRFEYEDHPTFNYLRMISLTDIESSIIYFVYRKPSEITLVQDELTLYSKLIELVLSNYKYAYDENYWNALRIQSLHNLLCCFK